MLGTRGPWGCPGGSGVLFFAPMTPSDGRLRGGEKPSTRPGTPTSPLRHMTNGEKVKCLAWIAIAKGKV